MEARHGLGGVTHGSSASLRGLAGPVGRGQGVEVQPGACGAVAGQYCRRGGRRKLEAMGLATHQVVGKDPACGGPGGRSTPNLRRRADDRLAEVINADRASVAAAAGTRAAWRHDARPGRRGSCCCTMLILARSSECRARQAGRVGARLSIDYDVIVEHNGRSQRPARTGYASRSGKRRIRATASTVSRLLDVTGSGAQRRPATPRLATRAVPLHPAPVPYSATEPAVTACTTSPALVISTLRGLASSATGMVSVSTPFS